MDSSIQTRTFESKKERFKTVQSGIGYRTVRVYQGNDNHTEQQAYLLHVVTFDSNVFGIDA